MKPALRKRLHELGIINIHDFAYAKGVLNATHPHERPAPLHRLYNGVRAVPMVTYSPAITGRAYKSAAWHVSQRGVQTDPNGHYRDNGDKTFQVYKRDEKEPQKQAALAWAAEHFGVPVEDWVEAKVAHGAAYMPREFVERRTAQLKAWVEGLDA